MTEVLLEAEPQSSLLTRIGRLQPHLRKSERAVAEFVLAKPGEVLHLSIAELAQRAGSSQPTVARFASALGYSGYREFKLRLAQSLAAGAPLVHQDIAPHDAVEVVVTKVFDRTIGALIDLRNHLDAALLEQAVSWLAQARRIEFYGVGNSGIVAMDAQHKFFRYGLHTAFYADTHSMAIAASVLQADDVVIAISASGRSTELCAAVEIARESGARVIGLTASGSPLARLSQLLLPADVPEDADVQVPMVSRLAHLAIIDVLAVALGLRLGPALVERLQRSKLALRAQRIRETDS